jgi:DNA-binding NtrC family response regulator
MDPTQLNTVRITVRGGTLLDVARDVTVAIDEKPVTVGRGDSCTLRLDDRRVSLLHCEFVPTEHGMLVRDHGSKNGTYVDDFMLGPGQFGYLRRDTTVRVGSSSLRFKLAEARERDIARKFGAFESRSLGMQRVLHSLAQLARVDVAVHITGESGTGKGYVARALHAQSARASKPFVVIDCSAIPPNLAESELFGHERGAFTNALKEKESPFVEADGGTVFLDEVGDLPPEVQAKLLHVVDEGEIKRIGQTRYRKVDVRILSATLHNLSDRVHAGQFREDLYNRLCATRIALPPLRERREDIGPLTQQILTDLGCPEAFRTISSATLAWMEKREWDKGNVRQLRHVLKFAVGQARGGSLDIEGACAMNSGGEVARFPDDKTTAEVVYDALTVHGSTYDAVINEATRVLLRRLLSDTGGNIVHMCKRAGLSRVFLRGRLEALGLRETPPPPGQSSLRHRRSQD